MNPAVQTATNGATSTHVPAATTASAVTAARAGAIVKAVLFDMDGVLASVGSSYREAIIQTASRFGVAITQEDITVEKKKGNANNDWILSKRLIENYRRIDRDSMQHCTAERRITHPTLEEVTAVFEDIYQGTPQKRGLCETETLIPSRGFLQEIFARCEGKLAIVTGRPIKDCEKFLKTHNLGEFFPVRICMETAPAKPDPSGVLMACSMLGVAPQQAIMIGDTPDDVRAAVDAGCIAWGVLTPEEDARIVLGLQKVQDSNAGMTAPLLNCGAVGVMRPGMAQMLDIIAPYSSTAASTAIATTTATTAAAAAGGRIGTVVRSTKETSITAEVNLDGSGQANISTGLGFLDHMLSQLAKHGRFDISLQCTGDLYIDDHHTAEDSALALGEAFDKALGQRQGIARFGVALCPLDESLSRAVVDISSRPHAVIDLQFTREKIGDISCEMLQHVLESFAGSCRITLHVHNLHGSNNHHKAESAFKSLGVALRSAVMRDASAGVPSTKGVLA